MAPFLKAFIEHIDDKGWFDTIYMGFDERRNMETALDLIASVKNKDGKTLKVSASFNEHNRPIALYRYRFCKAIRHMLCSCIH